MCLVSFHHTKSCDQLGLLGKTPCSRAGCATFNGARDQDLVTFGDRNQLISETQREVNFRILGFCGVFFVEYVHGVFWSFRETVGTEQHQMTSAQQHQMSSGQGQIKAKVC